MFSSTSPNTNNKQTKKCFNHDQSEFITTTQDIRDGLCEVGHPNVKGYRIATHHGFNSNYVRPGNPKAF